MNTIHLESSKEKGENKARATCLDEVTFMLYWGQLIMQTRSSLIFNLELLTQPVFFMDGNGEFQPVSM